jgi:antitoxin YefM
MTHDETAYLLRNPANARHLLESLEQARRGERKERSLAGPVNRQCACK